MPTPTTAEPLRPCTECPEPIVGGFVFRRHFGHIGCLAPLALAALDSETISVREAEQAAELVEVLVRARLAEARTRERQGAFVRELRSVVGLPAPEGDGDITVYPRGRP